jgi:hypothetical protein
MNDLRDFPLAFSVEVNLSSGFLATGWVIWGL